MEYADQLAALFTSNDDQGAFGIPKEKVVSEAVGYLPWRNAEFVFTSIRPFFDSEVFSISILKGLITSSGGLTESTLKASSNSLFEYLSSMKDPSYKKQFLGKLIKIFDLNLKDERVTVPLMKTIEMLLASDYLTEQTEVLLEELN
jgi:Tubulin folding cofactor D C terminal